MGWRRKTSPPPPNADRVNRINLQDQIFCHLACTFGVIVMMPAPSVTVSPLVLRLLRDNIPLSFYIDFVVVVVVVVVELDCS